VETPPTVEPRVDDSLRGLLASIVHDFRTPLAGITGIGRILEEDLDLMTPEMVRECVADMVRCSEELDRRITAVLDQIHVATGTFRVQLETVNARALLGDILDRLLLLFEHYTVELEAPRDLDLKADPVALTRIVENLLSNAVKYSPRFTLIEVIATRSRGDIVITVTDRGSGITAADADRIFGQFERLDSGRNTARGNGVGLSAVRHLAELMGGRAWWEPNDGGGSRFNVALPAA
jgi:K+-sensing histidine kinase KdpD